MNYFNINISQMPQQESWIDRTINKIEQNLALKEVNVHQSTLSDNALLYWRIFSSLLLTAVYIWTIVVIQQSLFENIMYLTMIGYLITWLYFTLSIQHYFLHSIGITSKKCCIAIQLFHQIGVCLEVPITLVFWGVLFRIVLGLSGITTEIIVINGFLHSAPLICLIIDFILNHFTFPLNHLSLVIIFDLIYLIINLSYSLAIKPIYKPIDWISWGSYIIAVVTLFLTMFIHFIGRCVHRKWKIHKIKKEAVLLQDQNSNQLGQKNNQTLVEKFDL